MTEDLQELAGGTLTAEPRTISEGDYAALRAELERAMRRICPAWLKESREDLVQNAILRMLEIHRRSEEAGEKNRELAPSYLWKVATTALIDEIRRLRRKKEVDLDEGVEATIATNDPGVAETLAGREIGRALRDCLQALVESRRLAVTLHLQGYAVAEAASLLAWDTKKVYNLVHRGLNDLRVCLTGKGVEP